MELEQPKPENLDQVNSELDHQQQQSGTSLSTATGQSISIVARSYECTFCKRGFSNAQALGGHMNIHRKDKAKLRQANYSSNIFNEQHQQQVALDNIPKMPPSYSPIPVMSSSSETKPAGLPRRPLNWFLDHNNNNNEGDTTTSKGTDHGDQVLHHHQLRLFDETPPPPPPDYNKDQNPDHSPPTPPHHHHYQVIDVKFEKGSELDLELRLGPEPQDAPAAIGTRKFFY